MPLQKQDKDVFLVGGVDQKTDRRLVDMGLLVIENLRYAKRGSLTSRYGVDCIGPYNKRDILATTPPAPELLTTNGSELVRVGVGQVESYALNTATTSDWVSKGRTSEVSVEKVDIAHASGLFAADLGYPDVAYVGGNIYCVYASRSVGSASYTLYLDITNATTGAHVVSQSVIVTEAGAIRFPKVVPRTDGTFIYITWYSTTNGKIYVTKVNGSTYAVAASSVLFTTTEAYYDMAYVGSGSTELAVLWCNSGTGFTEIYTVTSAYAVVNSANIEAATSLVGASLAVDTANARIWCLYAWNNGGTYRLKTRLYNLSAAATHAVVQIATNANPFITIGNASYTSASQMIVYATSVAASTADRAGWCVYDSAGAATYTKSTARVQFISRPFLADSRSYVLAMNEHSTHGTYFLLDLDPTIASAMSPRIAAVALPRQWPGNGSVTSYYPRRGVGSSVANTATGKYIIGALASASTMQVLTSSSTSATFIELTSVVGLKFTFDSSAVTAWNRTGVPSAQNLLLPGGCPGLYDGRIVAETSFAYEPDVGTNYLYPAFTGTTSSPGGMTGGSKYGYAFIYTWTDAKGQVHRSGVSEAVDVTLTSSNNSVTGTIPYIHLTNKTDADPNSTISVEVYRTVSNGSIYYFHYAFANAISSSNITFTDVTDDASLTANATLYTTDGSVERDTPSSGEVACMFKNAPILARTDDDSIWIGPALVAGEAPYFSESITIPPFDGGRVTAVCQLDTQLIIFKNDSIYYILGEPPNSAGNSTLSTPQRIQTDVGCTDPRSVVAMQDGLMFRSRGGLYILTRALQVLAVGNKVEDLVLASNTDVRAATIVPDDNIVRFVAYKTGNDDSHVLDYDYQNGSVEQPIWSVNLYTNPKTSETSVNIMSACFWNGLWTYLTSTGLLYQEKRTQYHDTSGVLALYPSHAFSTAFQRFDGITGWQRLYRVGMLASFGAAGTMTIGIYNDYDTNATQSDSSAPSAASLFQRNIHVSHQKCSAVSFTVSFNPSEAGATVFHGFSIQFGIKGGPARLPGTKVG